jgi:hypothetical protein
LPIRSQIPAISRSCFDKCSLVVIVPCLPEVVAATSHHGSVNPRESIKALDSACHVVFPR